MLNVSLQMTKKVCLIRHGEALHNINWSIFGKDAYLNKDNLDAPLTDKGKLQATNLSNIWVNKCEIDIILVSPLTRTLQTANCIFADKHDIHMIALDSIKEFPQGKHTPNIRKSKKELEGCWTNVNFNLIEEEDSFIGKEETETSLINRIENTKEFIRSLDDKINNIAIVSHSTFITKFIGNELEDEDSYGTIEHCSPYYLHV